MAPFAVKKEGNGRQSKGSGEISKSKIGNKKFSKGGWLFSFQ